MGENALKQSLFASSEDMCLSNDEINHTMGLEKKELVLSWSSPGFVSSFHVHRHCLYHSIQDLLTYVFQRNESFSFSSS